MNGVKVHRVYFYVNPVSHKFRAVCSCGWTLEDDQKDELWIRGRAACHDLEEDENVN